MDFTFGPDGKSLAKMQTIGPGRLVVDPADSKLGEREITAGEIQMAFDARGRLDNLLGSSPTRIVFHPAPSAPSGSVSQVSSADQLEAKFDPASQTLVSAEQSGNFQFQDGDRQVTAERGNYWAARQVSELTGRPEVTDPSTHMTAERLNIDLRTDTAEGLQKVVSTHFRRKDDAAAGAGRGEDDDPTHVLADRMVAQRRTQFVHYEGHVRAWHGTDVVESSSLDVSRVDRQVRSGLGVLTSHFQPAILVRGAGADAPTPRPTRPVTIRADHLDFFDEGRKAAYRGKVELRTENTTLDADHMEVFFSGAGPARSSEIQRAVADGHVTVVQPGRRATGERGEYEAAPGKIVLTGGPPTLIDAQKGTTTGERLTFFVHDDRLLVDGGHESPALSQHRVAQ